MASSLRDRIGFVWTALVAHPESVTRACNVLAMAVASNQPIYPIYVWYVAGGDAALLSLWTWLSTPLFLAVPFVARRNAEGGKALLVVAGLANTLLCLLVMGPETRVGLFVVPCMLIAALAFAPLRRLIGLPYGLLTATGLGVAAYGWFAPALLALTGEQAQGMARLNMFSVFGLCCLIGWMLLRARLDAAPPRSG